MCAIDIPEQPPGQPIQIIVQPEKRSSIKPFLYGVTAATVGFGIYAARRGTGQTGTLRRFMNWPIFRNKQKEEIQKLRKEVTEWQNTMDKKFEEGGVVHTLQQDMQQHGTNLSTLSGRFDAFDTKMGNVTTRLRTIESDTTTIKEDVKKAQADVTIIKTDVEGLTKDIKAIKEDIGFMRKIVGDIITYCERNSTPFNRLKAWFERLTASESEESIKALPEPQNKKINEK